MRAQELIRFRWSGSQREHKRRLVIVGAGGHGISVLDLALSSRHWNVVGFLDDVKSPGTQVFGKTVLGGVADVGFFSDSCLFAVGVGKLEKHRTRRDLIQRCLDQGARFATIISASAVVSHNATVGIGSTVHHGAVVNSGARVGDFCIVNTGAIVEHGTLVGEQSHVSTGAILNGDVRLGPHSFVGSRAVVFQGVKMGARTVVPAGSLVKR